MIVNSKEREVIKCTKRFIIKTKLSTQTKRNMPYTSNSNLGLKLKLITKETKQIIDHKSIFVADLIEVDEYSRLGIAGVFAEIQLSGWSIVFTGQDGNGVIEIVLQLIFLFGISALKLDLSYPKAFLRTIFQRIFK